MKISISLQQDRAGVSVPKGYGIAYIEFSLATNVYYPIPINYIARYGRRCYWGFLGCLYWVGLIDVGDGEMFLWSDFYRIKTH